MKEGFNKEGHLSDEGLALYVDALKLEQVENLKEDIRTHIENCLECHQQALDLFVVVGDVNYDLQGTHPVFSKKKTLPKPVHLFNWMRLGMAVALFASVFILWNYFDYEMSTPVTVPEEALNPLEEKINVEEETNIKKEESVPIEKREIAIETPKEKKKEPINKNKKTNTKDWDIPVENSQLIAAHFVPSPDLEDLIGAVTRSDNLKIQAPKSGTVFKPGEKINFSWHPAPGTKYLEILNNREEQIHRIKLIAPAYSWGAIVSPGLYYWKLETEEDLIHIDKFIVK